MRKHKHIKDEETEVDDTGNGSEYQHIEITGSDRKNIRILKMASGSGIWLPNVENFFPEMVKLITSAEQIELIATRQIFTVADSKNMNKL